MQTQAEGGVFELGTRDRGGRGTGGVGQALRHGQSEGLARPSTSRREDGISTALMPGLWSFITAATGTDSNSI